LWFLPPGKRISFLTIYQNPIRLLSKLPEALVERFADDVTSAIFFHFGALLAFIGSDVTPVRQAKRVFERNIRQLTLACPRNIAEHEEIEQFNAIKGKKIV
jgi:hypothetical protein